jgi:hypothetical protein
MAELRTDSEEMKLVERLRARQQVSLSWPDDALRLVDALNADRLEAADTISRLVAERDEARKALKPFASLAAVVLAEAPPTADFIVVYTDSTGQQWAIRLDELRAAATAGGGQQ